MLFVPGTAGGRPVYYLDLGQLLYAVAAPASPDPVHAAALLRGALDAPPVRAVLARLGAAGPCLCQHYAPSRAAALQATADLRAFLRYYHPAAFPAAAAYTRLCAQLAAGAPRLSDRAAVRSYPPPVRAAWRAARACGADFGYCAREERLWVPASRPGRPNLLRRLSRAVRQKGGTLSVQPADAYRLAALPAPAAVRAVVLRGLPWADFWPLLEEVAGRLAAAQSASQRSA